MMLKMTNVVIPSMIIAPRHLHSSKIALTLLDRWLRREQPTYQGRRNVRGKLTL
jgi:hypothetical protein